MLALCLEGMGGETLEIFTRLVLIIGMLII